MTDKIASYRRRLREWAVVQRSSKATLVEAEEWIAHYKVLIDAHKDQ